MRKMRFTALFFIIIASSLMMAHAVVPHSHHDGIVCFLLEKTEPSDKCSHEHDDACSSQQNEEKHHHHEKSENCDLKDVLLRQDNQDERFISHHDYLSLFFILSSLKNLALDPQLFEKHLEYKPYLNVYHPPFTGYLSSLRAPPVFVILA